MKFQLQDWYYWGRWREQPFTVSLWLEFSRSDIFSESFLSKLKGDMVVIAGDTYLKEVDLDYIYHQLKSHLRDEKWFSSIFATCEREKKALKKLTRSGNIPAFIEQARRTLSTSALVELVDIALERYLKERFASNPEVLTNLLAAMQPSKETMLLRYQRAVHTLSNTELMEEFAWVGTHGFMGSPLTIEKITADQKSAPIIPTLESPNYPKEMELIVKIGEELAFQRSDIIEHFDAVSYSFWEDFRQLAKEYGLSFEQLLRLGYWEIQALLHRRQLPKNSKERTGDFAIFYLNHSFSLYFGNSFQEVQFSMVQKEQRSEEMVKGLIAQKGIVRGYAKILQEVEDIHKVKVGDILIAPETRPNYVPAMRKAAAFVTNQGGITSHAAIVAREMKKPCVIGTKHATEVFKDGDYVEVNANEGIVKLIAKP